MKRNFLLTLLLTLLPFVGWAVDVNVGEYTVTIDKQYLALTGEGVNAPAISVKSTTVSSFIVANSYVLDDNGDKVEGKITVAGRYFIVANFTDGGTVKVLKVPFYVAQPFDGLEHVNDKKSFDDSLEGGLFYEYYKKYPWCDVWYQYGPSETDGVILYPGEYPKLDASEAPYKYGTAHAVSSTDWTEELANGWADELYEGYFDLDIPRSWQATGVLGPNKDTYGFVYSSNQVQSNVIFTDGATANIVTTTGDEKYVTKADGGFLMVSANDDLVKELTTVMVLLVPANIDLTPVIDNATDLTDDATVTVSTTSLQYNGEVQYPTFSGASFNATVTYTPASASEAITLVEGRDFTAVYDAADDDYKSTGTHNFTVNFIGAYAGSKAATYEITKAHVNINLAYIYKTYGEADPALPANPTAEQLAAYTNKLGFEIDASTPLKGTDVKSDIAKYLIFTRATGEENEGEDVREYDYYYEKTADFADNCNYTVSFLQTKSLLIIQPKAVTIDVTPVYKKYHKTVELKYDADDLKAQLAEADKAKASGTPGATDLITSITWEGAGTDAGEAVNADLVDAEPVFRNQGTGYPMTATVAIVPATKKSNYTVTVNNPEQGFAIVPTDEANITVEIPTKDADGHDINGAVDGKFIYKAAAYEPEPVVKDGVFTLKKYNAETGEGDYTVTWNKNVDASNAAECIVTLCGSYTSATPITENFTISKADLVVKPVSATAEGNYTIAYETFQGTETAQNEYLRESDPAHAYFSVNPANITVVKGQEIEQDVYVLEIQLPEGVTEITAKNYNVSLGDALLALNNKPILRVRPAQNQPGKVYDGEEPTAEELQELAIEVQHTTENGYAAATANEIAALKILGAPVYEITKAPGVNVGRYRLTVTGTSVLKDYNVEYDNTHGDQSSRNYPITPAPYFIVVNNDPAKLGTASKTYGSADPTFTLTAATRTGEGTTTSPYVYTAAAGVTLPNNIRGIHYNGRIGNTNNWDNDDAGEHTIYVQRRINNNNWQAFSNWEVGNYIFTSVNGVLNIAKKAVTFTAENKSKVYGTEDPALTITPDPIVTDLYSEALQRQNGAYVAFDISRAEGEDVNTYTITLTAKDVDPSTEGVQLHNSLRNFEVQVQDGTFTITKATYTVRANDQWMDYGGEINPLDVTITLPGNETLRWQKAGINEGAEATAAREANNAKIKALGTLEVLPGKKAIGANKDAYKWTPKANANYELATGEAANYTVPATAHTKEYTYVDGFCNGYLTVYPLAYIPLAKSELEKITEVPLHQVLEDHKGMNVKVILTKRTIYANEWSDWVLPFEVNPRFFFSNFYTEERPTRWGYGAIDVLDPAKSKNGQIVFDLKMGNIPANTPFLVKVDEEISSAVNGTIEFDGVTIANKDADGNEIFYADADGNPVRPEVAAKDGSVKFIGLYDDKTGVNSNEMALMLIESIKPNWEFYRGDDNQENMQGYRLIRSHAFLQFPSAASAAGARIYIQEPDGTYTAINGVESDTEVSAEGIYNLSGQRVNKAQKGIYIQNGKKVLVK